MRCRQFFLVYLDICDEAHYLSGSYEFTGFPTSLFAHSMKYQIGDLEFDKANFTLLKEGSPLTDGTRPAMLLSVLLEHYPEHCSHRKLLQTLWPDTVVSQWSLSRLVSDTRKIFRENNYSEPLIETLSGRGYRLAPEFAGFLQRSRAKVVPEVKSAEADQSANSRLSKVLLALFAIGLIVIAGVSLANLATVPEIGEQVQILKQGGGSIHIDGSDTEIENSLELPYLWDTHHSGQTGFADFHLQFDYPEAGNAMPESASLYIPRVGNRYEIKLNGSLLASAGSLEKANEQDYAMQPVLYSLPSGLLRSQENQLQISVRTDMGRRGGLSSVFIGPHSQVQPLYAYDYRWVVLGTVFAVFFSLAIAFIALVLWFLQVRLGSYRREGDVLYAYLIVAELAWAVRAGGVLMTDPFFPWPYSGIIGVVAIALWAPALCYFYVVAGEWRQTRGWAFARQWLIILQVAAPLVAWLALVEGRAEALTWWYLLCVLTWGIMLVLNLPCLVRGTIIQRVLLSILLFNVLVAGYDLYNFRMTTSDMGTTTWMRYSVLLFGLSLLVTLVLRFRTVIQSKLPTGVLGESSR